MLRPQNSDWSPVLRSLPACKLPRCNTAVLYLYLLPHLQTLEHAFLKGFMSTSAVCF